MTQKSDISAPPKAKVSLQRLMDAASKIETPRVIHRWALTLAAVSSTLAVFLSIALVILLPLKEYVPYFLVEKSDASVERSSLVGARFVPSDANIVYFSWQFIKGLLTIDEQMRFRLPATYEMTRGAATSQWQQFVANIDRPQARLSADPTLRREVVMEGSPQIISASNESRKGSIVYFIRETTTSKDGTKSRRVRMTLDYLIVPPQDPKEIAKNPIGFYVTGFLYEPLQ